MLYIMCVWFSMVIRVDEQTEAVTQEKELCPLESLTQQDEGKPKPHLKLFYMHVLNRVCVPVTCPVFLPKTKFLEAPVIARPLCHPLSECVVCEVDGSALSGGGARCLVLPLWILV